MLVINIGLEANALARSRRVMSQEMETEVEKKTR